MSEEMRSESTMVASNVITCSICLDAVVDGVGRGTALLACRHRFHLDCIGSSFNYRDAMQCPNCRNVERGGRLVRIERGGITCSICLEAVVDGVGRGTALLACGHRFHLGCIGLTFNYRGAMQCPNCRRVERGRWLGAGSSTQEHPLNVRWTLISSFTTVHYTFEEMESFLPLYHSMQGHQNHTNGVLNPHVFPVVGIPIQAPGGPVILIATPGLYMHQFIFGPGYVFFSP